MTFDVRRARIDVTRNGLFGGPADTNRVYGPGVPHYYLDGREVDEAEFRRQWAIAHPDHPLP
jgi:hypothetical protein